MPFSARERLEIHDIYARSIETTYESIPVKVHFYYDPQKEILNEKALFDDILLKEKTLEELVKQKKSKPSIKKYFDIQESGEKEITIENGLDYFAVEKYDEAEEQIKLALEEKENDERAEALLVQIGAYREALKLFEEENFDEGFVKAQDVIDTPNGAASISAKAEKLISEQKEIQAQLVEEAESVAAEQAELERKEEEAAAEQAELERKEAEAAAEAKAREEAEALKAKEEANHYEYSDFIGYYLHFNSADRNFSDMLAGIAHDQVVVGWWGSEFINYDILGTSINGNTLTVDYHAPDPYGEGEGSYGSLGIILSEGDSETSITFNFEPENVFYKASYEEVLSYDYSFEDFVY